MLEYLGSTPDGATEWHCTGCGSDFMFAEQGDDGEIEVGTNPAFCPICGDGDGE